MIELELPVGAAGATRLVLRELRGADELALEAAGGVSTRAAVMRLLSCLVVPAAGCVSVEALGDLSCAERDRALAALYEDRFGARIEARIGCAACGTACELGFDLRELLAARPLRIPASGRVAVGPGWARPPSVREAELVHGAPAHERAARLRRLSVDDGGGPALDDAAIDAALESAAPLLDVDLDARCAACGASSVVRFEIAAWLARAVLRERPVLLREVHVLARAYGWSLHSILELPRSQRQMLVGLAMPASVGA